LVGFLIVLSGLVSAATISKGFVGYFRVFVELPDALIISLYRARLGALREHGLGDRAARPSGL